MCFRPVNNELLFKKYLTNCILCFEVGSIDEELTINTSQLHFCFIFKAK